MCRFKINNREKVPCGQFERVELQAQLVSML